MSSTIEEAKEAPLSAVAIAAGAVAAAALTLALLAFGVGMGFSSISPWFSGGVSATTFKLGVGIYLIVIAMLASSVGGYFAGRLRTKWTAVHSHEVFFRDTAHGFLAWSFSAERAFTVCVPSSIVVVRPWASRTSTIGKRPVTMMR
jgi:hypothetical protein